MRTLVRRVDRRLVDAFGMVGCPRAGADVDLDTCLACQDLVGATRDEYGRVQEVRCRATLVSGSTPEHWFLGVPPL